MDKDIFIYIMIIVLGGGLFPLLMNAVVNVDTSTWTFTGYQFCINLLPYVPYIFLLVMVLVPIYAIIRGVNN